MKKKTHEDFIGWLDSTFKKWHPILQLGSATCDFKFSADCPYMECINRYPYLDYRVRFSQKAFEDWQRKDEDIEHAVVHEFCHIITDPLYNKGASRYATKDEINDERERLTDVIAQIVMSLAPQE